MLGLVWRILDQEKNNRHINNSFFLPFGLAKNWKRKKVKLLRFIYVRPKYSLTIFAL